MILIIYSEGIKKEGVEVKKLIQLFSINPGVFQI